MNNASDRTNPVVTHNPTNHDPGHFRTKVYDVLSML